MNSSEPRQEAERLRESAARLEPDAKDRKALMEATFSHTERFLESLMDGPAFRTPTGSPGIEGLRIGEEGKDIGELLDLVKREIEEQGLNPASPGDFAWVPGGGLYASALGDYLAAVGNAFAGHYAASSGAVLLENRMVRWIADLVGYPETAGGTLTSGGSIAGLTAILAAREAKNLRGRDFEKAAFYVSGQAHYSVEKAVRLAGMGEAPCRLVAVDERRRMVPESLARLITEDEERGLRPWLVVTNAGTTNTGAVDPLDEIGAIARTKGLWHHVDGAYGGFYLLAPSRRHLFLGIAEADSVVLDPHKTLFLPYGSGAVVVRDARHLDCFRFKAAYLPEDETEAPCPSERSLELTRHFRAMRLFLPLLLHGTGAFADALEEKWLLARYLHERVREIPEIEVGPPPELQTVCFRWTPAGCDLEAANRRNRALLEAIQGDGRIFISATVIDGVFWQRPSLGIFRTHVEHVDEFLAILVEKMDELRRIAD